MMPDKGTGNMMRWAKGLMLRNMPFMITCVEFEDFIVDYLEGELPDRQRAIFEFHLKICRECRDYLAAYQVTIAVSGRAFDDPDAALPDDVPSDLVEAILAAKDGPADGGN